MLEGAVVSDDVVEGMVDLGLELGVDVVGVVMAAGVLVSAYVGELGVVRVPGARQGIEGEPLGFEMPRVGGDSTGAVPLNPNLNHLLYSITNVNDQEPHTKRKRLISALRLIEPPEGPHPRVLYAFYMSAPQAAIGQDIQIFILIGEEICCWRHGANMA